MRRMGAVLLILLWCLPTIARQPQEPIFRSAQLPEYPRLAVIAQVQGEVKSSFLLNLNGEVVSVETLTGNPLLRKATEGNIRTWKFFIPKDLPQAALKCDTAFRYRLSGRKVEMNETAKVRVTVDSFHKIEILSDGYLPNP
jgi:TonB-like protein